LISIEVFPFLEILPRSLLLTPNMRYTLRIQGGPSQETRVSHYSQNHIKFSTKEPKIATINGDNEVTAHEVGDTEITYEVI
jgi:hypothetical protein